MSVLDMALAYVLGKLILIAIPVGLILAFIAFVKLSEWNDRRKRNRK